MFGTLTQKFTHAFRSLMSARALTEENISEAVKEVRLALLEADVNFNVVKNFVKRVKEKAVGAEVTKSVTAAQQFFKIVHDELVALMGDVKASLDLSGYPTVVMLCGLQGSGKTTQAAKLAKFLLGKDYQKKPLLVACDLQRPAAVHQLKMLADQVGVPFFTLPGESRPEEVAKASLAYAKEHRLDVVIIDTAGRLQIDDALMEQLQRLKQLTQPKEVLFVANATTGQDAVTVAQGFDQAVGMTGTILTMLDSNARAGAALSIREVTGKPLKFEGIGEKMDDFQLFHPQSMADRILGMGDTINLVRKAEEHFDKQEAEKMEEKLRRAAFTFEDYLKQMRMMQKMGPLQGLLKMLPGMDQLGINLDDAKERAKEAEAIVSSMTPRERQEQDDLTPSRRRRVAAGCGIPIESVNRFIKGFRQAREFIKETPSKKKLLEKLMGEQKTWR